MAGGGQTQLADPLIGQNHFTAVRWGLAGIVALGHVWLLTVGPEPLQIHGWLASYMAVNGFFVLSGLLIAKSLHTRRNLGAYAQSRILRIYPALIVVMVAFLLVFMPLFSHEELTRSRFLSAGLYVLKVLAMGDHASQPAHIYADNLETVFNDPLWTIRYELAAYILAAIAFIFGFANGRIRVLMTYLAVQSAYVYFATAHQDSDLHVNLMPMLRLSSSFLLGMLLWHWREFRRPPIWAIAGLATLFGLFGGSFLGEIFANWALTAIILRLGLPKKANARIAGIPDYSYGIYIWHFPVMQSLLVWQSDLNPLTLLAVSTPVYLSIAAISWHFIEKPALAFKTAPQTRNRKSKTLASQAQTLSPASSIEGDAQ
ncbi:acyltransferase [Henriciella mobilis]|uniref:acyltransferase family protein n=1 Tax=Henriciella mobilis TaxID=2305467 RepID=UPI000E664725|nr:acyltransferase [Henriciella mobilis]RIJ14047.1 acyltransferase [Henriciella mobilis]RIJ20701.1 acyltransferase [Henriciella mobilis]